MKRNTPLTSNHVINALRTELPVPTAHQEQLRLQLIRDARAAHSSARLPRSTTSLKELFMKRTSTLVAGGFTALALIAGAVAFSVSQSPSAAAATIERSQQAVNNLSQKDFDALQQRISANPKSVLEHARTAPDLKEVACNIGSRSDDLVTPTPPEGFNATNMQTSGQAGASATGSSAQTPGALKCYSYTENSGAHTTLGIDAQNLPVFVTVTQ